MQTLKIEGTSGWLIAGVSQPFCDAGSRQGKGKLAGS